MAAQFAGINNVGASPATAHHAGQGLPSSGSSSGSSSCSSRNSGRESSAGGGARPRSPLGPTAASPHHHRRTSNSSPVMQHRHLQQLQQQQQQQQPGSSCVCDGSRPLVPDPLTGQPICACQLESGSSGGSGGAGAHLLLGLPPSAATRLTPSGASAASSTAPPVVGPAGVQQSQQHLSSYPSPYLMDQHQAGQPFLPAGSATDPSSFYAAAGHHDLKESLAFNAAAAAAAAAGWPYPSPASMYYPCDPSLAGYPFPMYGMDLNGSRRKNATRETTATLKAWLSEHKKNPYPTKGEKIMLAIITKMTLTQVSTWFANARRRLKKENKMTWEPKNRNDEDDDDDDCGSDPGADHHHSSPSKDHHHHHQKRSEMADGSRNNHWSSSSGGAHRPSHHHRHDRDSEDNIDVMLDSDEEELDLLSSGGESACLSPPGGIDHHRLMGAAPLPTPPTTAGLANPSAVNNKPKIWSIADMAGGGTTTNNPSQQQQAAAAAAAAAAASAALMQQHHHQQGAFAFPAMLPFGPLSQAFSSLGGRTATGAPHPYHPFLTPNNNSSATAITPGNGKLFPTFDPTSAGRLGASGAGPYGSADSFSRPPGVAVSSAATSSPAYRPYPPSTSSSSGGSPPSFSVRHLVGGGPSGPAGVNGSDSNMALAYNQLMSSMAMAAHFHQQQQLNPNNKSPPPNTTTPGLQNLEKLAALAAAPSTKTSK